MVKKTKNPKVASSSVKKTNNQSTSKDLLLVIDGFLDQRLGWMIWIILGITFLFSLLLFDSRVSLSGDDSFYIIGASNFIHSFKYPGGFQGPLYPMVLSIFVAIFGTNLIPLKVLSLISFMCFMYLLFIIFRSRIPSTLLVITLIAISVNSFLLYYASQTYTEAFYIFVQIVLILVFFRHFIDNDQTVTFRQDMKRHILLALSLLALILTKNIGYSAIFAITGYFILRGQWKNFLYSIAAFGILLIVFQIFKYLIWSDSSLQFSSQGSGLLNKDYYNPRFGKEDLAGFFMRFIENSKLYLSKQFPSLIGLRTFSPSTTVNAVVTVLVYLLTIGSLLLTFKKNNYLFFTGLLTCSFLLVTFIIMQTTWDQSRLIIPVLPMLLLMLFSFLYYVLSIQRFKILQIAIPIFALLIFFQSIAITIGSIKAIHEKSGQYGGLSPDWVNYLKASEWAAMNLPREAIIACRKPSISFVYGKGHNFYGIMNLPTYSTDIFFNNWLKDESAYMLFKNADLNGKRLKQKLNATITKSKLAILTVNDTIYFANKIDDRIKGLFSEELKSVGLNYISSASAFRSVICKGKVLKLYYPDSLINQLQKAGVTHILTANLRYHETKKDGLIINTVEQYMFFIKEKYPQIFSKVSQFGDDNNEPATILNIEYEKYGFSVKNPVDK